MTEIVHLKCDRCGAEEADADACPAKGWAYVSAELHRFHFCPECWRKMRDDKEREK
jgi:hypothetical protein